MLELAKLINQITEKIQHFIDQKLWGELIIKFKDGRPVMVTCINQNRL